MEIGLLFYPPRSLRVFLSFLARMSNPYVITSVEYLRVRLYSGWSLLSTPILRWRVSVCSYYPTIPLYVNFPFKISPRLFDVFRTVREWLRYRGQDLPFLISGGLTSRNLCVWPSGRLVVYKYIQVFRPPLTTYSLTHKTFDISKDVYIHGNTLST